jgi:hypothetical protein
MTTNCSNINTSSNNTNISNTPVDCIIYDPKSFLPPYNGENYIQIRDINGVIRYKIYNNTLTARYVNKNILFLKTASENRIIRIEFKTNIDASNALVLFSDIYNNIREL